MKKIFTSLLLLLLVQSYTFAEVLTETLQCTKGTIVNNTMEFSTTNFTIIHSKGNSNSFAEYSPWRIYEQNLLIFTSKNNNLSITKIELIHNSTKYGSLTSSEGTVKMANTSGGTTTVTIPEPSNISSLTLTNEKSKPQAQLTSIIISYTLNIPPTSTIIISSPAQLDNFVATKGNSSSQAIKVGGNNLTDNISLNLSGANANQFDLSSSALTPTDGTVANTEISVNYKPTEVGSHTATLTLSSTGADDVIYTLNGTATLPQLTTSTATAATNTTATGLTANWDAVTNANGYKLAVDKVSGEPIVYYLNETFDEVNGTGGNDGQWSGSIASNSINITDWKFENCGGANKCIKAGAGSKLGKITTLPLTGLNGNSTLTFRAGAWNDDNKTLKISIINGGELDINTIKLLNAQFSTYTIKIKNATPSSQIVFEGFTSNDSRFFLDDVKVFTGDENPYTPIAGSPFTVDATKTSFELTGLNKGSEYQYSVVALGDGVNYSDSESSNIIKANTTMPELTTNLGEVLTNGVAGDVFKLNIPLIAKYVDNNGTVYASTEKGICSNFSTPSAGGHDSYEDKVDDFDQRDWIALKGITGIEAGKMFEAGLVGVYGSEDTPTLTVTTQPTTTTSETVTENMYQVRNFAQYTVGGDYKPFWVEPKLNEVATVIAKVMGDNMGGYVIYDDLAMIAIDNSTNLITAESDKYVEFKAIVKRQKTDARSAGTGYDFAVMPISTPQIISGVETTTTDNGIKVIGNVGAIEITAQEGADVAIYNLAGVLVNHTTMGAATHSVATGAGIYVVKVNDTVAKVVVK